VNVNEQNINIAQTTSYPWGGQIGIEISPENQDATFTLKLRIPGWARNEVLPGDLYSYVTHNNVSPALTINGEIMDVNSQNGYYSITRQWSEGDKVELHFPMNVQITRANDKVEENLGKRSFEYGPVVYCVEEIDNPGGLDKLSLSNQMTWNVDKKADFLGGVNVLYVTNEKTNNNFLAIPYYAWSNRGIGTMKVWLPFNE
jgi:DUF1680 family protein